MDEKLLGLIRRRYELCLERVRLRCMHTLARASHNVESIATLASELTAIDEQIVRTPGIREERMRAALGLDDDEVDLLWTAVAVAHDPRVLPHAIALTGGEAKRGVSLALHAAIAGLDGERARDLGLGLDSQHPLVAHGILTTADDGAPVGRCYAVSTRASWFLSGVDRMDPILTAAGYEVSIPRDLVWTSAQDEARSKISHALGIADQIAIVVEGGIGVGRRTAIAEAARAIGRRARVVDATRLPTSALVAAIAALLREAVLDDIVPIVAGLDDALGSQVDTNVVARQISHLLDRAPGTFAVTTTTPGLALSLQRRVLRVVLPSPDMTARARLWAMQLARPPAPDVLEQAALRYRLGAGGIRRAARTTNEVAAAAGRPAVLKDVIESVRNDIAERMSGLATRVPVDQSWADLVIAPDTLDQIYGLIARVRHAGLVLEQWGFRSRVARGGGIAALFAGGPGTGKTMVAGLIAKELELELYMVDLSKIVSKWVGETEKQLAAVFEAAEAGHSLLLFDEADALFAKRTEVKAAVDRYANLEVNYLLQRIESFGGVTILTTNMDASIDPALKRRLAAHITFWPPELEERTTLWAQMIPHQTPLANGQINFRYLANEFPDLSGANIRNAVVAAAFLAASENALLSHQHLERAAKAEYQAMGRMK